MSWTVTPAAGIGESALNDPHTRLAEYLKTLVFYLTEVPQLEKILIFENSGYDFTVLQLLMQELNLASKVEFVSTSTDYDPQRGKGYGEFRMYDEGLRRSARFGPATRLWKVTGRLIVRNLAQLIESAPTFDERPCLYCDLRRVPFVPPSVLGHWMDTRLFAFNLSFYRLHFEGQYGCNYIIEEGFFKIVNGLLHKGGPDQLIVPRFRLQPELLGRSGTTLKSYRRGKHRLASAARNATRRVAPWLWL
jgi:hypothetical protein